MLKTIRSIQQLSFSQLMEIYEESNTLNGQEKYPLESTYAQVQEAEQDFYQYLSDVFFRQENSFYAVWTHNDVYVSALRIEPYMDGVLLCALETALNSRRNGYASKLISSVIAYLAQQGSGILYSHVSKQNTASVHVHQKCGFQIIKDYAVYSDGSVLHGSYTLAYEYEKSET